MSAGLVPGREEFRQELLEWATEWVGPSHCGRDCHESGEQKAERLVREELRRLDWDEHDLRQRRKGAKRLRVSKWPVTRRN
jgi:hypothetical protein